MYNCHYLSLNQYGFSDRTIMNSFYEHQDGLIKLEKIEPFLKMRENIFILHHDFPYTIKYVPNYNKYDVKSADKILRET